MDEAKPVFHPTNGREGKTRTLFRLPSCAVFCPTSSQSFDASFMLEQKESGNFIERFAKALTLLPRKYVALILCAVILLVPFPTTVVPEWKIKVLNPQGKPVSGVRVRQTWTHYSLELDAATNQEQEWSNESGYVIFPRRTITKGLLHRAVLTLLTGIMIFAHGSTGVSASVWAVTDKCSSEFLEYKISQSLPDAVVLRCAD